MESNSAKDATDKAHRHNGKVTHEGDKPKETWTRKQGPTEDFVKDKVVDQRINGSKRHEYANVGEIHYLIRFPTALKPWMTLGIDTKASMEQGVIVLQVEETSGTRNDQQSRRRLTKTDSKLLPCLPADLQVSHPPPLSLPVAVQNAQTLEI